MELLKDEFKIYQTTAQLLPQKFRQMTATVTILGKTSFLAFLLHKSREWRAT